MGIFKDIKNLLLGMKITGKHLGRHAITIQYPEERWTMPERSRGMVVLLSDKKTGELNCTGCELCMRACPTAAIYMYAPRDEKKRKHLEEFRVDHGLCCFCGLCEEACNFCAIKMATKYEFSALSKDDLVWDMKKLQEMGRDVDYVDTRKKKPAKPKPPETAEKAAGQALKPELAKNDDARVEQPAEANADPESEPTTAVKASTEETVHVDRQEKTEPGEEEKNG